MIDVIRRCNNATRPNFLMLYAIQKFYSLALNSPLLYQNHLTTRKKQINLETKNETDAHDDKIVLL